MRIAVTGGSGAIGFYVCDELRAAGHSVVSVDRAEPRDGTSFVQADLSAPESACNALEGFDHVVHLAAIPHPFDDPSDAVMSVNMTTATSGTIRSRLRSTSAKRSGFSSGSRFTIGTMRSNGNCSNR